MKELEKIVVAIKNGKAQIPRTKNVEIEINITTKKLWVNIKNLTDKTLHIKSPHLFIGPKKERFWVFANEIPKELDLTVHEV